VKKNGYTIIELMIGVIIVGILAATLVGGLASCSSDWERAEKDGKEFCSNIPGWSGKISCSKKDTDKDGYCACTCFLDDGTRVKLDCGCEKHSLTCNNAEGCKEIETIKVRGVKGGDTNVYNERK
jgi:prepilin-type N-terminal cleavage/methylation domain-containing protein